MSAKLFLQLAAGSVSIATISGALIVQGTRKFYRSVELCP